MIAPTLLLLLTAAAASAQPAETPVAVETPVATGTRPLRVFAAAGVHAFFGEGWNEKDDVPGEDPPKSEDYLGGGLRIGASWEFTPSIAAVGQAGGHQGRHSFGEEADPEPLAVTYGLYYAAVGARWQTRPARLGFYAEGGGGFAVGRVIVTRPDATNDAAEAESFPTFLGYGALGVTAYAARGVDVFLEARALTAPHGAESFTSDHELDLGGFSGCAGISLRL